MRRRFCEDLNDEDITEEESVIDEVNSHPHLVPPFPSLHNN